MFVIVIFVCVFVLHFLIGLAQHDPDLTKQFVFAVKTFCCLFKFHFNLHWKQCFVIVALGSASIALGLALT